MSYVLYSSGSRYGAVVKALPKSDPTTCQAGLRLYSYLKMLGGNAFYFTDSTDSVIYKWWPGQPQIPLSSFLGDMTDELEDPEQLEQLSLEMKKLQCSGICRYTLTEN